MSQNFAAVVEEVKQLSTAEKEELQELIRSYLVEERRREIQQNYDASVEELRENKLTFTSDSNALRESLSHD